MPQNKQEYKRGFGDGVRWTIHWLHERAKEMNDPHAQQVLNAAAFNLGNADRIAAAAFDLPKSA